MWKRLGCVGVLAAVVLMLPGCEGFEKPVRQQAVTGAAVEKEKKSEVRKETIKPLPEDYEKYADAINFFCEAMNVPKDQLTLYDGFTDTKGNYCLDIGIQGNPEKSGTYVIGWFLQYHEEIESRCILKIVSDQELDDNGVHLSFSNKPFDVCKMIYDSSWEEKLRGMENLVPVKPEIDDSFVKTYKETLLGTGKIWESYDGFIDEKGNFCVSYVGDVSDGWVKGVFDGKDWKCSRISELQDEGADYNFFGGTFDSIWYYDYYTEKILRGYMSDGKKKVELDVSQWVKDQGLPVKGNVEIHILNNRKAIFSYYDDAAERHSVLVGLPEGTIERKYAASFSGISQGDTLYEYLGPGMELCKITDWKTGEVRECLDLSPIIEEGKAEKNYFTYSRETGELFTLEGQLGESYVSSGNYSIKLSVYKDTLYVCYFSGVYRYNSEKKVLEKILDGKKQPQFQKMYGNFDVGKDEKIYMLGFLGGGDDEGANDFLYLTKK
ncbi:MAG: hypothetical protein HFG34_08810 [Eubacterium sp.]|nr:hypothetical protein [Eubacterium sp.]